MNETRYTNSYYTENHGWLEFDEDSYRGYRDLEQDYYLMEAYCVTRQEWGYLGRASCGGDCMCAAVYFPPDATGLDMQRYRYMEQDKAEAVKRECVRGDHQIVVGVGNTYCSRNCGYMTFGDA